MRRCIAALLALCTLISSGCLKAHSLDRYGYVIAVGYDRGKDMPYKITLMLQNMQTEEGGQTSAGFTLVSAECRGLFEAVNALSGSLPFTLDFSRTMIFVFSQELAREEGILTELLSVSFPKLHIRYNANVYVSLGTTEEAFKGLENKMEPNLSRIQKNDMLYAKSTGLIPVNNLTLFSEAIGQKYEDAVLPLCGKLPDDCVPDCVDPMDTGEEAHIGGTPLVTKEIKTGLAGAAIFASSRMVGILDGQSTQLLLMTLGEFREGRIRLKDAGGNEISLLVSAEAAPKKKLTLSPDPAAWVGIWLSAVPEQPENIDAARAAEIGQLLAQQITDGLNTVFSVCRERGSDAMGFGRCAVMQFPTAEAWADYDWHTAYQRLQTEFSVTVTMDQAAGNAVLE